MIPSGFVVEAGVPLPAGGFQGRACYPWSQGDLAHGASFVAPLADRSRIRSAFHMWRTHPARGENRLHWSMVTRQLPEDPSRVRIWLLSSLAPPEL